ncbi:hypothetical protein HK414_19580 [Ramlibacter terrae]|uniref:Transmembrane protein n=1 Tax=Ramlibacter terrae TaxID=2732511 RepID=A0ABX6P4H1_9BURK|nr:hypothetical protein HK414_19580 [Ramlibacter terrae]
MLLELLLERPQAATRILAGTPSRVWLLLAGFTALGLTQLRDRRASLLRVSLMPLGMTAFSLWGTVSALNGSPLLGQAPAAWLAAAALFALVLARGATPARYDPVQRTYALPGSAVPLLLILAIFLLKYGVGVELRLAPERLHEAGFMLAVTSLYGAISGIFPGRAARLWRLSFLQPRSTS